MDSLDVMVGLEQLVPLVILAALVLLAEMELMERLEHRVFLVSPVAMDEIAPLVSQAGKETMDVPVQLAGLEYQVFQVRF